MVKFLAQGNNGGLCWHLPTTSQTRYPLRHAAPILVKMLWYTLYIYHCINFIKSQQLKLATCFDPRHCNKIDSANAVWMTMGDLHIHGYNCKIFWNLIIKLLSIWGVDLSLLPSVHCPYNYFRNVKYCVFGFPWI